MSEISDNKARIGDLLADERDLLRKRSARILAKPAAASWFLPTCIASIVLGAGSVLLLPPPPPGSFAIWLLPLGMLLILLGTIGVDASLSLRNLAKIRAKLAEFPAAEVNEARKLFEKGLIAPKDIYSLVFALIFAAFLWKVAYDLVMQGQYLSALFSAIVGAIPLVVLRWRVR